MIGGEKTEVRPKYWCGYLIFGDIEWTDGRFLPEPADLHLILIEKQSS
jgi:hypothetical protein